MEKLSELFHKCAYDITYQQAGDSVNYAFVEDGTKLYIYFQGSNSISDWVRNFLFPKKPYKDMGVKYYVHRGFLAAWKEVEDIIIKKICSQERLESGELVYRYNEIVIVGYSHGGALSGFCHECCWFWRPDIRDRIHGYGFESPRFMKGFKVKKELKERWANYVVIRDGNDLVTHCPPRLFRFCHVGSMIIVKGDIKLVTDKVPKCIKYHYPQPVYDGLIKYEAQK